MTCARSVPGTTTLTTLDLTDAASEAVIVRSLPQGCASSWADGVFLESWNDDALVVDLLWDERFEPTLIGADGTEILAESDDPILVEGVDGRYYRPVPGVANTELVVDTAWSPDGSLVAVNITPNIDSPDSLVRIMDAATGVVIHERDGQGSGVISMTWSTDSRFLLYSTLRSAFRPGLPGSLVIHDVTTDVTTTFALSQYVDEIRTEASSGPG
jgi:WD40 repeat protein